MKSTTLDFSGSDLKPLKGNIKKGDPFSECVGYNSVVTPSPHRH